MLLPPISLSTLLYSFLLLLGEVPLLHYILSLSSICFAVVPLPPPFSFLYSLDTLISCAPFPHIWSIVVSPPQSPASSPPLLHTASPNSSTLQIYSPSLSPFFALLYFYTSRWGAQTSYISYIFFLLCLLILSLIWQGPTFSWAYCSWVGRIGPEVLRYVLNRCCVKTKDVLVEGASFSLKGS